ncbi:hypothetical protein BD289DRAFT_22890 [Coniella lustricola]|uniref:Uncharacterized protein n=1 Tax=Coniella lustricola TaxID=2025994 RepID=A0A2T3A3N2_9PEZI|nr:hypothetical protein BD289DRAFT_22890 [Coniella lustricola]
MDGIENCASQPLLLTSHMRMFTPSVSATQQAPPVWIHPVGVFDLTFYQQPPTLRLTPLSCFHELLPTTSAVFTQKRLTRLCIAQHHDPHEKKQPKPPKCTDAMRHGFMKPQEIMHINVHSKHAQCSHPCRRSIQKAAARELKHVKHTCNALLCMQSAYVGSVHSPVREKGSA